MFYKIILRSHKLIFLSLLLILALSFTFTAIYVKSRLSQEFAPQPNEGIIGTEENGNSAQDTIEYERYKVYQNADLGIAFDYPAHWGNINMEESFCVDGPWVEDSARQEWAATEDPCMSISLKAKIYGENREPEVFLYSHTPLYREFLPAYGFPWVISDIRIGKALEDYCVDFWTRMAAYGDDIDFSHEELVGERCDAFINRHGMRIWKSYEASEGESGFFGWQYHIKLSNKWFPALILGAWGPPNSEQHLEVERLVNSIKAI